MDDSVLHEETYLDRIGVELVQTPVIIQVEADQTQNGDVEQHLPPGDNTAVAV